MPGVPAGSVRRGAVAAATPASSKSVSISRRVRVLATKPADSTTGARRGAASVRSGQAVAVLVVDRIAAQARAIVRAVRAPGAISARIRTSATRSATKTVRADPVARDRIVVRARRMDYRRVTTSRTA